MLTPLLLSLLAAAPLSIRVLEHARPLEAAVEATAFRCDGAPVKGTTATLRALDRRVRLDDRACDLVELAGPVRVQVGELSRRYDGGLTAVNAGEQLKLVLSIDVERYLPSVVSAEARGLPPEALAAQAVVSRTFALASRRRHGRHGYDLCDLAHCMVFQGQSADDAAAAQAVERTRGQVLLVGGVRLAPAFFHAACGGGTATAQDVFQERGAGLPADDRVQGAPRCEGTPGFHWTLTRSREELARAVGAAPVGPAFEPLRRDAFGRVLQVRTFGKRLSGADLQSLYGKSFGWSAFRSLNVTASELDEQVTFTGRGVGHGVGLCQQGAAAMAAAGAKWPAVLKHYFGDSTVGAAP